MPHYRNIRELIEDVVEQKLQAALAPILRKLEKVQTSRGEAGAARRRGRPPKAAVAVKAAPKRRARRGSKARKLLKLAKRFSDGQKVSYRQGRGTFEAKVVRVDVEAGLVTIERTKDKKQIVRPATKLIAG